MELIYCDLGVLVGFETTIRISDLVTTCQITTIRDAILTVYLVEEDFRGSLS